MCKRVETRCEQKNANWKTYSDEDTGSLPKKYTHLTKTAGNETFTLVKCAREGLIKINDSGSL